MQYTALVPCLLAAIIGDWACRAWGLETVVYTVSFASSLRPGGIGVHIDPILAVKVAIAGVMFGLVGLAFSEVFHRFSAVAKALCPRP